MSIKLLDAGTSIGANLEEGQEDPPLENELRPLLQETNEFIAMLTTLLKTARSSSARGSQNLQ